MSNKEIAIIRLKELISILESDVTVVRCKSSMGMGEPMEASAISSKWSYVYKIEIEMHQGETRPVMFHCCGGGVE